MSFGSETGRTRSGSKSFSSKEKKQRRKKQDYHVHKKARFQEADRPDPEEVRKRTILALDRLGHQVLSSEPGGYDLGDWMRSLNSLLDDFQDKVGDGAVGDEFRARSRQALSNLVPSSSASEVDREIEKTTKEVAESRAAVEDAEKRASAKLASLREERDASAKELKLEKDKLAEIVAARQSRQFFSRFLRAGPSTAQAETRVAECESRLKRTEEEIERLRKARSATEGDASGGLDTTYLDAKRRLEVARARLLELQASRQDMMQLAREREEATQTLSAMVSGLRLSGSATSDTEAPGK